MKITTLSRGTVILATLGLVELMFTVVAAPLADRETTYPLYLVLYLAMGVTWLVASYYVVTAPSSTRAHRRLVVLVAVVLRVPFLLTEPLLSDDIFATFGTAGSNTPGSTLPLCTRGARARISARRARAQLRRHQQQGYPNCLPPFMQMAFFAATAVSTSVGWMKLFFVLADLALVLVLMQLLGTLGLNPVRALIYAWSPLVVVEVAGSGHNDALAVLCLMAALLAIVENRQSLTISMFLLTLSGMGKIVGFTLTPLWLRSLSPRALLVMPLVSVLLALPYASAGSLAFRGLTQYGLRWRGNDGLFHILYYVTGSLDTAKIVIGAFLVTMVLVLVAMKANPLRSSYLTLGAILLLTTTLHPWYLLWIAPFLAIYASPAWLYLSLSVALAYHSAYLATPGQPWEDVVWVKLLEYVPFFVLAIGSVWRERGALRAFIGLNSPP